MRVENSLVYGNKCEPVDADLKQSEMMRERGGGGGTNGDTKRYDHEIHGDRRRSGHLKQEMSKRDLKLRIRNGATNVRRMLPKDKGGRERMLYVQKRTR
jgi:hypothetical protein